MRSRQWEELIGRHRDRKRFECGVEDLDTYLRRYARQNHEPGGAKTVVAASAAELGGVALAIDAKDRNAVRWYERFGAVSLLDDPLKLILPLAVIAEALYGGSSSDAGRSADVRPKPLHARKVAP